MVNKKKETRANRYNPSNVGQPNDLKMSAYQQAAEVANSTMPNGGMAVVGVDPMLRLGKVKRETTGWTHDSTQAIEEMNHLV
ncbi:hypothetical protein V6N13_036916 [Hibiscus sabdariffa]